MTPIGVGIVGLSATGGWAATAHVPALSVVDGVELRGLSASSPESARAAGERYGVPGFGTPAELAASDAVDLVVVAVKVPYHRELVGAALAAGKAVLCEWPLGAGLAETEELAALAAARGVRTAVGLQARSAPTLRYLRDLVAGGYAGRVLSTTLVADGVNWGATVTPSRHYQLPRDGGATMLTVPIGHTLDALAMVLGEFEELTATTATRRPTVRDTESGAELPMTAEDQVAVTGVLDGGAVAAVHFRGGRSRGTSFRWEINGTDGDLVVTVDPPIIQLGRPVLRGGTGTAELAELAVPASYQLVAGLDVASPAYPVAHAYAQLVADLTGGTAVVPDFGHAAHRHRVLDAVQRSAATGRRVTPPAPPAASAAS
jgi:predicted dehydrogenase